MIWIWIIIAVAFGFYFGQGGITGLIFATEQQNYADNLSLTFDSSQNYTWEVSNYGDLKAVRISGTMENEGQAKVYISDGTNKYLVFDSSQLEASEVANLITGFAVSNESKEKNNAPEWVGEDSYEVNGTLVLNLDELFKDEDGDELGYAADESVEGLVVVLDGSALIIDNQQRISGKKKVDVYASDGESTKKKKLEFELIGEDEDEGQDDDSGSEETNDTNPEMNETTDEPSIENETSINQTSDINLTVEINQTIEINGTQENETALNETQENETITSSNKTISLELEYKTGSIYDVDDNGIETKTGIVDLSVEETGFNWAADESKLCTRWDVYSAEEEASTQVCYGSAQCCNFIGMQPSRANWSEEYYSYYGQHGATENNVISAQVAYVDYSLDIENPYSDIAYSEWRNLSALFYTGLIAFENVCEESCSLDMNLTEYTLIVEIEDTVLTIEKVNYTIEKEASFINSAPILISNISNLTVSKNRNITLNLGDYFSDADNDALRYSAFIPRNFTIVIDGSLATIVPAVGFVGSRYMFFTANDSQEAVNSNVFKVDVNETDLLTQRVEVGKPVRWIERVSVENVTDKAEIKIAIPKAASNVTIKKVEGGNVDVISEDKVEVAHENRNKTLDEFEKEKELEKIQRKLSILKEAEKLGADVKAEEDVNFTSMSMKISEAEDEREQLESEISGESSLITGYAIWEVETIENASDETVLVINDTSVISSAQEIEIEYETEAPYAIERSISGGKEVRIVSETGYENVFTYTAISETKQENIRLYWIINGTKELFSAVEYVDTNLNGMVDRLEWVVPHLSNQTFEISISVLNVQSYPTVGGNWTVRFNTTGTANLTVIASNGTTYSELDNDYSGTTNDLIPLSLYCGSYAHYDKNALIESNNFYIILQNNSKIKYSETIGQSFAIKGVYVENYSCSGTAYWTVQVLTSGVHSQQFNFSGQIAYANNLASYAYRNFSADSSRKFTRTTANDEGIVAYWSFDDASGQTAKDEVGGNEGRLGTDSGSDANDPIWARDNHKGGYALRFDGVNDYVNVSHGLSLQGLEALTVEAWIKPEGSADEGYVGSIVRKGDNGAWGTSNWAFFINNNNALVLNMITNNVGQTQFLISSVSNSFTFGQWYHVAGVYDGANSDASLYINGMLVNSTLSLGSITSSRAVAEQEELTIGVDARSAGLDTPFNGTIDEVRIYNRSLSSEDVYQHYKDRIGI